MLRELLHWLIGLAEVLGVTAAILVGGILVAMATFWVLARGLGQPIAEPAEPDPEEYEMDDSSATVVVPDPPAGHDSGNC